MAEKVKLSTDEAVKEIKGLIIELKLLDKTLGKMSTGNVAAFNKMASSMGGFKSKITELNNSIKRLGDLTKTNSKRLTRNSNEIKRNGDLTKTNSKNKRENTTATNKNTRALLGETKATNKNTVAKKKNTNASGKMLGAIKNLIGKAGLAALAFVMAKVTTQTLGLIVKFESLGFAIKQTAGSVFEVGRSTKFLLSLNQKFGASLISTTERWLKFRTAARQSGLTLLATKNIFESVTKASAVLGLRTDELRGVYLALEQMLSKGKVTTEELRRQLGERLPGAMGIMAASMGVSIRELDKMLKKGEVLSAEVLPNFAKALELAYGIDTLDKVENLATSIGKLEGAWESFVLYAVNSGGKVGKVMKTLLDQMTSTLDFYMKFFATDESKLEFDVMKQEEGFKKVLKTQADLFTGAGKAIKGYNDKIKELKDSLVGATAEQQKIINLDIEDNERMKINIMQESADKQKAIALDQFKETAKQYELDKIAYEEAVIAKAKNDSVERNSQGTIINRKKKNNAKPKIDQQLDTTREKFIKTSAAYNIYRELIEEGTTGDIDPNDDGSGTQKKIKLAKKFEDSNKLLIEILKERVRLNKELAKDEEFGLVKRIDMSFENAENLSRIAELEKEDRINANKLWLENEDIKLAENLTKHKGNQKALTKQEEENNKQREYNLIEFNENNNLIEQDYQEQLQKNLEQGDVEWEKIQTDKFIVKKDLLDTELQEEIRVINLKLANTRKGSNEEARLQLELADLKVRINNSLIELEVAELERQLKYVKSLDEEKKLLQEIRDLKAGIKTKPSQDFNVTSTGNGEGGAIIDPEKADDAVQLINGAQNTANEIISIADQVFQNRIDNIQKEIDEETEKYDRLLELAKNDAEETKIIERNKALRLKELNRKKAIEQEKQAKIDKALRISQAVSGTATAIIMALAQPGQPTWLSIANAGLVAAAGAAEIATIIATPIPQFAEGGIMEYDGKAQINDGGRQEYVERNGQLLTSSQTNAVVDLKKGDVIHKDFETLQKQSMLLSLTSGGEKVSEKDFNLAFGIKEEIKAGFNKAKVNSNVTVLNETNSYRDKMSMWD